MRGGHDAAYEMALELNGGVRPTETSGDFMCLCPAHADGEPSLAVKWDRGRLVYHCYAQCQFGAIATAIRERGLDPISGQPIGSERKPRPVQEPRLPDKEILFLKNHVYEPTAVDWIADRRAFERIADGPNVARYVYRGLDGTPMMTVTRSMKPHRFKPGLHKVFVPVTPWRNTATGNLDLPSRAAPEPRLPYGAETLSRPSRFVVLAEGEKCRDCVEKLCRGRMPTISTYGSTPYLTDFKPTAGRTLIVSRDSDEPGIRYAANVAAEHAGRTIVVEAPPGPEGRPDGWDVADWAKEDGDPDSWAIATAAQLPADVAAHFLQELAEARAA